MQTEEETASSTMMMDPWSIFLYGMKAPMTREKYRGRLAKFFDFISFTEGTMEERAKTFTERGKKQPYWVFVSVLRFANVQKERVANGEISPPTLRNYIKAIKLFCEMNDIVIVWRKITRGLPKARRFADDRAPTLYEIRRVVEYPDRRIKAVVYTMTSSGIRLEAWNYLRWSHVKPIERDGKMYAVCDRCSHMNAPLSMGTLNGKVVTCAAHGARFDVTRGNKVAEPMTLDPSKFPEPLPESLQKIFAHSAQIGSKIKTYDQPTYETNVEGRRIKVRI